MRERACRAVFDASMGGIDVLRRARAMRHGVQWTVAEQAIDLLESFVAGIVLAGCIAEERMGRLGHGNLLT